MITGCNTRIEPPYCPDDYLQVLGTLGRPDSVLEDNLNRRRTLVYFNSAYIFTQDGKLIEIKNDVKIQLISR